MCLKKVICFCVCNQYFIKFPPPSLNIPDCAKVLCRPLLFMFCLENEKWVQRFIETWQHVYEKTQFVHFQ